MILSGNGPDLRLVTTAMKSHVVPEIGVLYLIEDGYTEAELGEFTVRPTTMLFNAVDVDARDFSKGMK